MCGEEVLPDYPHDEVKNPGVNHFPDGVFQKCLKLIQREREAERERLKKIKRQRNNAKERMQQRNENVVLPTTDEWGGMDELASPQPPSRTGAAVAVVDQFDAQWDMALSTATVAVPLTNSQAAQQQYQNRINTAPAPPATITPAHGRPGATGIPVYTLDQPATMGSPVRTTPAAHRTTNVPVRAANVRR